LSKEQEGEDMIRIKIDSNEHKYNSINDLDESWIAQQVNRRQADGKEVCVRVFIKHESVDVRLGTPACKKISGSSRQPRSREEAIFDLWEQRGLNKENFSGGNIVAFFKQLRKLLD
jgi:hypothetical protein